MRGQRHTPATKKTLLPCEGEVARKARRRGSVPSVRPPSPPHRHPHRDGLYVNNHPVSLRDPPLLQKEGCFSFCVINVHTPVTKKTLPPCEGEVARKARRRGSAPSIRPLTLVRLTGLPTVTILRRGSITRILNSEFRLPNFSLNRVIKYSAKSLINLAYISNDMLKCFT